MKSKFNIPEREKNILMHSIKIKPREFNLTPWKYIKILRENQKFIRNLYVYVLCNLKKKKY